MNPIAVRPISPPTFLGNALQQEPEDWLADNAIHLRERWRYLLDSCLVLDMEPPPEQDYEQWTRMHYELEQQRLRYLEGTV